MHYQKGSSTLELLISMTLGVMISIACIEVFLTTKKVFIKQNAIARIQENARVINYLLGNELATSGNMGCNAIGPDYSMVNLSEKQVNNMLFVPNAKIVGLTYDQLQKNPFLNQKIKKRIKPTSDILLVKRIKNPMPINAIDYKYNTINIRGYLKIKKDQILVISDCAQAIFVKTAESEQLKGNTLIKFSPQLTLAHQGLVQQGMAGRLSSQLFYIGNTGRLNANGTQIEALYSTDLNGRTLELAEGVEQMEVKYEICDGPKGTYVAKAQVRDWLAVNKVKISLLLNSIEDVQNSVSTNDRLLKKWWHFEWPINAYA